MNKKAFINKYVVGLLLFTMIVTGFWIVPQRSGGFWEAYGYNVSESMTQFDVSKNVSRDIESFACDLKLETCTQRVSTSNYIDQIKTFTEGMFQGGFSAMVSIYKSFGISKVLVESVGNFLGVEPFILIVFTNILLFSLIIWILFIMFNRQP